MSWIWIMPTALSAISVVPAVVGGTVAVVSAVSAYLLGLVGSVSGLMLAAAVGLFHVALLPISIAWSVAFLVLSPVIYTIAYTMAPFWYLVSIVPKLQPLYIYFGSATFVGIIAGAFIKLAADLSIAALRLDKEDPDGRPTQQLVRRESTASTATSSVQQQQQHQHQQHLPQSAVKREEDYFAGAGVPEIDWQVIDRIESRGPHSEHMRRMPLLQSIILEEEEDDSSVGGY